MPQRIRSFGHRQAVALLLIPVVALLLTPAISAKSKPKSSEKQHQDFTKYVEIQGATKVGGDQCAQCHADVAKNYGRSQHSMRAVECEQCHGAGSLHLAAGGYSKESKDKIVSFKDRPAE